MEESNLPPIDPDFEPQSRPRSCTWPLPRPDLSVVKAEGTEGTESATGTPPADEDKPETQQITPEYEKSAAAAEGGLVPSMGGGAATPRKGSSRRNAWGNQSYADLISQAIENSPEKRLTLAQIYEWMVKTVPYFRDKGDSNSSAGWKNSIRHNLSLHNKFLRVHNESTGKSSWWMLNPEGGKTGKAPRRRAASMDNSSKLLKSRMRAKQTKKQAVATGLSSSGATLQTEGNGASAGSDSPNSSQQFSKWGVNSNSPSSRGSLDDADMWTTFRPRTSSNASTLSGRLSPIAPGQEDDDNLPDDSLLGRYATPTLTETLMEELDLIDGLTLMTAQGGASPSTAPPAPPTPLPSASTLLPRGSSFSSFHQRHSSSLPQTTPHSSTSAAVSQCGPSSKESSFSNSLFNPLPNSMSNSMSSSMSNSMSSSMSNSMSNSMSSSSRGSNHYSGHVPSSLEALLTSDSPPPSEVLLSQVDPLMQSPGGVGLMGMGSSMVGVPSKTSLGPLLMGKGLEPNTVAPMALQMQPQTHHLHQQQQHHHAIGLNMGMLSSLSSDTPHLSGPKAQHSGLTAVGSHHQGAVPSANPNMGLQGIGQFGAPSCFQTTDRLPTDLDIDMFTENLDCDVDYIINTDLMDGIDFNFDPILPDTQGYTGPASTQGSSHNWVPS